MSNCVCLQFADVHFDVPFFLLLSFLIFFFTEIQRMTLCWCLDAAAYLQHCFCLRTLRCGAFEMVFIHIYIHVYIFFLCKIVIIEIPRFAICVPTHK